MAYLKDSDPMNKLGTESTFYVLEDIIFTNSSWEIFIQNGKVFNRFESIDQEIFFCSISTKDQRQFSRKIPRGRLFKVNSASSMGGGHLFSVNFTLVDRDLDLLNCNQWYVYQWPTIGELRQALGNLIQLRIGRPRIFNEYQF